MSATVAATLSSPNGRVCDDLNRESLPQTHYDPLRKVTWMNAVCASVLTVGVLLTKEPARLAFHPELIDSTPTVIPEFVPEITPQTQTPQDQVEETVDQPQEAPVVATVVVADPSKVAFAVPVTGPTVVATDFRYVPPPPRVAPKEAPSRPSGPSGPVEFRGANDGGYYPKIEYPREALLRRETGETRLYVEVSEDGAPEKVEVRVPSGSYNLDNAAKAGVKRLWRWPSGPKRQFIVPILFQIR